MAFQVSPGVNVSEIDLTTIVPAVATSIAGLAGYFEWGPANTVVLIDTPKTFRNIFGDVKEWNYEEYFTVLNFLGYSRGIKIVRTMGSIGSVANANSAGKTAGDAESYAPNDNVDITTFGGGFYSRYAGEKGNSLAVSIGGNGVSAGSNWTVGTQGTSTYSDIWSAFGRSPDSSDNLISIAGATTFDMVHIAVLDQDGLFTGTKNTILEKFENVSLHPRARRNDGTSNYFKNIINTTSQYIKCGGAVDNYDLNNTAFYPAAIFGGPGLGVSGISDAETDYVFSYGGTAHVTISLSGGTGDQTGSLFDIPEQGYEVLADAEKEDVNLLLGGGINIAEDVQNLVQIAETRKDCVAFLSCDIGKVGASVSASSTESAKADRCIAFKNNVGSSSYVFIDSGYKKQFDPYNQVFRWVPLNGDTAGLVARTEFTNDAWWSPAGYNRGVMRNAEALAFNPSKIYRDRLYPKGINPVIFQKDTGILLLGDKTGLQKPSAFDRINVRRLFIVLEKAIATASKYSLFEFNDSFTRSRFVSLVTPFLSDVKARRGMIDFKVVCDESNNTPERIDRNEFWADIYIKPNRSINYIQLNFIATRTGASFSEVGA